MLELPEGREDKRGEKKDVEYMYLLEVGMYRTPAIRASPTIVTATTNDKQ